MQVCSAELCAAVAGQAVAASEPAGTAGYAGELRLVHQPDKRVHEPVTQRAPQLTEDALQERECALAALGGSCCCMS